MKLKSLTCLWLCSFVLVAIDCQIASALVVVNINPAAHYVAPVGAADPGWANSVVGRSSVYIGNGWVISARHGGRPATNPVGGGTPLTTVTLDSGTYNIIPNSAIELTNPAGLDYVYHFSVGTTPAGTVAPASALADIVMFRIDTAERYNGTPEQRAIDQGQPLKNIVIANTTPGYNTELTILASGGIKDVNTQRHWVVNDATNPPTWTEQPGSSGANASGFSWSDDTTPKSWGTNRIGQDSWYPNEPGDGNNTLVIRTANNNRHTISHLARFDSTAGFSEAMPVAGDSGGGVFYQQNGEWRLLGVMHTITSFSGQPGKTSIFGQLFTFSDFSNPHYYAQIQAALNQENFSVVGDVNLDGIVSGDGTGAWATDDVTAFIEGWAAQSLRLDPQADIFSWKMGDLNQDARTDVADFLMLREALGATGASLNLAGLLGASGGGVVVPEPGTFGILTLAALSLLGWRCFHPRRRIA